MSCNLIVSNSAVSLYSYDLLPLPLHSGIIRSSFVTRNEYLAPCTLPPYIGRRLMGGFELNRLNSIAGRFEPHLNAFYETGGRGRIGVESRTTPLPIWDAKQSHFQGAGGWVWFTDRLILIGATN